jgi:hypothetical protein
MLVGGKFSDEKSESGQAALMPFHPMSRTSSLIVGTSGNCSTRTGGTPMAHRVGRSHEGNPAHARTRAPRCCGRMTPGATCRSLHWRTRGSVRPPAKCRRASDRPRPIPALPPAAVPKVLRRAAGDSRCSLHSTGRLTPRRLASARYYRSLRLLTHRSSAPMHPSVPAASSARRRA